MKIYSVRILYPERIYLFPAASLYYRALTWPTATSRTSTAENSVEGVGIPGYPPVRMSLTKASLEFACFEKAGPVTKVGKMLINYISPLCFSAYYQNSFSAKNLLFG